MENNSKEGENVFRLLIIALINVCLSFLLSNLYLFPFSCAEFFQRLSVHVKKSKVLRKTYKK